MKPVFSDAAIRITAVVTVVLLGLALLVFKSRTGKETTTLSLSCSLDGLICILLYIFFIFLFLFLRELLLQEVRNVLSQISSGEHVYMYD